jgi:hypothetical protein
MSVREQLTQVDVLILHSYLLFLSVESHFQGLLLDHWHIDIDTPDFFGVP